MWGKEVSAMVRKEMKKEEKKHNFTCIPCECRQWWQQWVWGLRERGNGSMVVHVPPDGVVVIPLV